MCTEDEEDGEDDIYSCGRAKMSSLSVDMDPLRMLGPDTLLRFISLVAVDGGVTYDALDSSEGKVVYKLNVSGIGYPCMG